MKYLSTVLLLWIVLSINAQTKTIKKSPVIAEGTPESVGMSFERLAIIETMCTNAIENGDLSKSSHFELHLG